MHLHAKAGGSRGFRHDRPDGENLQRTNGAAFLLLPEHGQQPSTLRCNPIPACKAARAFLFFSARARGLVLATTATAFCFYQ